MRLNYDFSLTPFLMLSRALIITKHQTTLTEQNSFNIHDSNATAPLPLIVGDLTEDSEIFITIFFRDDTTFLFWNV